MLSNFLENLPIIKQILIGPSHNYKISPQSKSLIYSDDFEEKIRDELVKIEDLCKFIDIVQSSSCSIGKGLHEWLKLKKPTDPGMLSKFMKREKYVNHQASQRSYVLTPNLKGALLPTNQRNAIIFDLQTFISRHDSDAELTVVEDYVSCKNYFGSPALKKLEDDPANYWTLVKRRCGILGELGHKYCSLPAGTAEIERLFSNASYIHDKKRNRLTDDRSEKLLLIYNSLRYTNKINNEAYSDDENGEI